MSPGMVDICEYIFLNQMHLCVTEIYLYLVNAFRIFILFSRNVSELIDCATVN